MRAGVAIVGGETTRLDTARNGHLFVVALDADGKPLKLQVVVRNPGFEGVGEANRSLSVGPGAYDVGVRLDDADSGRWWSGVEVVAGKTTERRAPQLGRLFVGLEDPEDPIGNLVTAHTPGRPGTGCIVGHSGKPLVMWPGVFDIEVRRKPPAWFRGVKIESGKTTEVDVGHRGWLLASLRHGDGTPLAAPVEVFLAGARDGAVRRGRTGQRLRMRAARYDVRIEADAELWLEDVAIEDGKTTTLELDRSAVAGLAVVAEDGEGRNLSTTLRHRRFLFTDSFLLLWKWRVG